MADSMSTAVPAGVDGVPEATVPHPSRRLEVASAVVCLALSLTLYLGARGIELRTETGGIDPRWWPQLLGLAGMVLSAALLATALLRPPLVPEDLQTSTRDGRRRLALGLLASVALVVLWPVVGFLVAMVPFVAGLTYLFGGRGWRTLVLFPVLLVGFLYVVFDVALSVPL